MFELKPDFDEADGVIGETEESQNSNSTEAEIQFLRADVEEVRTEEARTKEVLTKGAPVEEAPTIEVANIVTSVEEILAKGALSEEIVTWST